jgi:hypothetical protein
MAEHKKKRRISLWLLSGAGLLLFGAWLMRGDAPVAPSPVRSVNFPKRMSPAEDARATNRKTWFISIDAGTAVPQIQRPTDPLLALMPSHVKRAAMVLEFNAVMNSELGQPLLACLFGGDEGALGLMADAGLDVRKNIDRVGFVDNQLMVTGDFRNAKWPTPPGVTETVSRYGDNAQMHRYQTATGTRTVTVWNHQMVLAQGDEAEQRAAVDRLENRGPPQSGTPALDESMAYGEAYGLVKAEALAQLFARNDEALADTIRDSAKEAQLHLNLSHDVGLVADIQSSDPSKTEALRKTLGSALSLARVQAQSRGQSEAAQVLDMAMVSRDQGGGGFRLQAGIPFEMMNNTLQECVQRRKDRTEARRSDAGPGQQD